MSESLEHQPVVPVNLSKVKINPAPGSPRPRGRGKIDDATLFRLVMEEGRSQKDAARRFGVSEAAVSKKLRAMGVSVTRHVIMEKAAQVADRGLDAFGQLQRVNTLIWEELEWASKQAKKPEANRQALQSIIATLADQVRKQITTQNELLRSLFDIRAAEEFQREVIDAIQEESPDTAERIIRRLKEARAVRTITAWPGSR